MHVGSNCNTQTEFSSPRDAQHSFTTAPQANRSQPLFFYCFFPTLRSKYKLYGPNCQGLHYGEFPGSHLDFKIKARKELWPFKYSPSSYCFLGESLVNVMQFRDWQVSKWRWDSSVQWIFRTFCACCLIALYFERVYVINTSLIFFNFLAWCQDLL